MDDLERKMRAAFSSQRTQARRRGIGFEFTFEEWRDWWAARGRWPKRGNAPGALVMARRRDRGPYALGNVYCTTAAKNLQHAGRNRGHIVGDWTTAQKKLRYARAAARRQAQRDKTPKPHPLSLP